MKKNGDSVRDWAGKIFRRFLSRTSLMVTLGVLGLTLYAVCSTGMRNLADQREQPFTMCFCGIRQRCSDRIMPIIIRNP